MGQKGFWDHEKRHNKLAEQKDILPRLQQIIPWEKFREQLQTIHQKERKSSAGRKPLDVVLMFKILILQRLYNISDAELEYQVNDRLSFMQFLGLGLEDRIPDATTVWLFREQIITAGLVEELFDKFNDYLTMNGYAAKSGQIIDATLVPVPKQRISTRENEQIKEGKLPEGWEDQPKRVSQKDVDARWTKKNDQSYYGYKDHVNVDVEFGFIRRYEVTSASVHDSKVLGSLLDAENESDGVWADSAYRSEAQEKALKLMGFVSHIHERKYRNRELSEEQKERNSERSKTRAKVEHNFGSWVNDMGGKMLEVIGLVRVKGAIGLRNLAYNFKRYLYWQKQTIDQGI